MEIANQPNQITLIRARVITADGGPSEAILAGPSAIAALLILLESNAPVVSAVLEDNKAGDGPTKLTICERDGVLHTHVFIDAPEDAAEFAAARIDDKTMRACVASWGACFLTADYFKS